MDFEEIRSFRDDEIHQTLERIYEQPNFWRAVEHIAPNVPHDELKHKLMQINNIDDFQKVVIYQFLKRVLDKATSSISQRGIDTLPDKPTLFITNHRDIVLDSAILGKSLVDSGRKAMEIAIGDNLLIEPWIKDLVRLNKSFIVKRGGGIREQLTNSMQLSAYIRQDITQSGKSVWIAQREGRAKNSDDRTQDSLLKMLALSGEGSLPRRLSELNICPVALSYEFDPCDYLKAQEMQQRRDIEGFKKSTDDDLRSMATGVLGWKGRVTLSAHGHINDEILEVENQFSDKKAQVEAIAKIIDRHIHANYVLYPINYVAYDLLRGGSDFADNYTGQDRKQCVEYFKEKLSKIQLPEKDEDFLYQRLLEMYANPMINHIIY